MTTLSFKTPRQRPDSISGVEPPQKAADERLRRFIVSLTHYDTSPMTFIDAHQSSLAAAR
jgi:hypothetical protein